MSDEPQRVRIELPDGLLGAIAGVLGVAVLIGIAVVGTLVYLSTLP